MKNGIIAAGLIATLAVGFMAGRATSAATSSAEKNGGQRTVSRGKTRAAERTAEERGRSPGARLRQEIRSEPGDRIPQLVFRALETGDPILRRQLMSELYGRMDAGNYGRMMEEVLHVSDATGREYPEEYLLMAMRAGQVAGHEAMDGWKARGIETEAASKTFTGWAHVDPEAARRWLDANPDLEPPIKNKLFNALLTGAMVNDLEQAARLYSSLSAEDRDKSLSTFTNQIVQIAGKETGVQWIKGVMAAGGDDPYVQKAATSLFDRILWSGANRRNAGSMVRDLESLSVMFPEDADWITRGMGQIRDRKTVGGIELLDELSRSPVFKGQEFSQRQWNSAVDFALQRDPSAVEKWLGENPSSPIHGKVLEMTEHKKAARAARNPLAN